MFRIVVVLLALILAACTAQGSPSAAESAAASAPAASTDASAGTDQPTGEASPACTEAFAPIAELSLESTSDLGDLAEVEATVEACESVADWIAGASAALGTEVNPGTADLLLGIRCSDPGLSNTAVCQDLASS